MRGGNTETTRPWGWLVRATAWGLLFPGLAFADISPEWFALARRGPVRRLVSGPASLAMRRLQRPECAAVLSDFHDAEGRLLTENLTTLGLRAHEYFQRLRFFDGETVPLCDRSNVAAAGSPGLPLVAICTTTFERVVRGHRGLAANLLIHEMLHALGLEENPPTSIEITLQVVRRCGQGLD